MPKAKKTLKTLIIKYLKNFIILTCSLSNSLCAGADSLIILVVEKNLSPSSPLLEERGRGAENAKF
ncbi:hypothetical protein DU508_05135 [Pedobacter chinensis]|uniref:Uncharacterized protein n=1 Tax=Pedobacter chinensis TaxID=2282421 RepID=A0A369Q7R0_9SPHI|nr:hypothetical protein [Pedobacter chinensis]RDC58318.1 hypothetical protein DU508_05135 [Pedobacter chinensis]